MEKWRYLERFESEVRAVFDEMVKFLKSKQVVYGPHSIGDLGERGVFCRVWDKVHRLKSIIWDAEEAPLEEPRVDTWRDLLGYALYGLMLATGRWPEAEESRAKPLAEGSIGSCAAGLATEAADTSMLDEAAKAAFVTHHTRLWGWDREYAEWWWRTRGESEREKWRDVVRAALSAAGKG